MAGGGGTPVIRARINVAIEDQHPQLRALSELRIEREEVAAATPVVLHVVHATAAPKRVIALCRGVHRRELL